MNSKLDAATAIEWKSKLSPSIRELFERVALRLTNNYRAIVHRVLHRMYNEKQFNKLSRSERGCGNKEKERGRDGERSAFFFSLL